MSKDLILTYATDVEFSGLQHLIASARKVCPTDQVDIVVIINPMGDKYAELADKYDVQLLPCNSVWKQIRPHKPLRLFYRLILASITFMKENPKIFGSAEVYHHVHRVLATPWQHAIVQRHFVYEDFLRIRSTYRMVLLTDARDVIFQANPFEALDENKLHVFLQHNEVYGQQNLDTTWVNDVLGTSVADQLRGKFSSCCGTVIGGRRVLIDYLKMMTDEILRHQFYVIDQAIHNKIIHLDFPPDRIVLHPNTDGVVLTLGGMGLEDIELTAGDLKFKGQIVPIMHMYDRIKEINDFVCNLYPDDLDTSVESTQIESSLYP
jgi:hypothetical protein